MKKIILIIGVLAVLILSSLSFVSAINPKKNVENKESPLYKLRIKNTLKTKVTQIIQNIKTKFLGQRTFFIPILDRFEDTRYLYLTLDRSEFTCSPATVFCFKTACCKPTAMTDFCWCTNNCIR